MVTQETARKYEVVEDLPGVGPSTADKLKELGFHTVESLATATIRELVPAGIGEKQAAKIIGVARDSISLSFIRADELMRMKANVLRLTTGSKSFDELIGGGLETQTITEVYGEYGVGKSILCHQLAVNVQLPVDKGGLDGGALYLDTEQTFRPEWIVRMAKSAGLEATDVAQRIIYSEAYNSGHRDRHSRRIRGGRGQASSVKPKNSIPTDSVNRFFQSVEARAWTDAEKELDGIRQKAENALWYKGYVKALEGLLLTYRTNDDKYIYLPKMLGTSGEESINQLRKDFGEFAANEIHGEYDRGYFKALEDYVTLLSSMKSPQQGVPATPPSTVEKKEPAKKDEGLEQYTVESS